MAELELHIECRGCGRIAVRKVDEITPFEQHRLKCRHCGARDPQVTEHERRVPFTADYAKPSLVRVWPPGRRE